MIFPGNSYDEIYHSICIICSHNRFFLIIVGLKGQEEFLKVGMKYTIKHGVKW